MIGLGIDLCQVERIEKAMAAHANFLSRYYTEEEQAYIAQRGKAGPQSAAAMFAAKEALLKAMGVGLPPRASYSAAFPCGKSACAMMKTVLPTTS